MKSAIAPASKITRAILSGREAGEPPPCLFDYLPKNALLVIDESHQTIPQLGAMYKGDRSRKETLVEYGFRLPSALDNRPLRFEEFELLAPQTIYVSATPGPHEKRISGQIVEQVVRPTGLIDPVVEVRPVRAQVDDLLSEIRLRAQANERVLVTTLTKRMAEDLTEYLNEHGVKVRYLAFGHRDRGALGDHPRSAPREIRCDRRHQSAARGSRHAGGVAGRDPRCRQGGISALGGVADPDHRPRRAQCAGQGDPVCGRAYRLDRAGHRGDRSAPQQADRIQRAARHHAAQIVKAVSDVMEGARSVQESRCGNRARTTHSLPPEQAVKRIKKLEAEMMKLARNLEFEQAARVRDEIQKLRQSAFGVPTTLAG